MALLAILIAVVMGILARVAAVPLRLDRADLSGFLLVAMFSNGGNYGLPVVLFAFGNDALPHATVYFVISSILTNTVWSFSGRCRKTECLAGNLWNHPNTRTVRSCRSRRDSRYRRDGSCRFHAPDPTAGGCGDTVMILILGMQLEHATVPERPRMVATSGGSIARRGANCRAWSDKVSA
jgi:hypothetical protein